MIRIPHREAGVLHVGLLNPLLGDMECYVLEEEEGPIYYEENGEKKNCCDPVKKNNTHVHGEEKNCCNSAQNDNPHVHMEENRCCDSVKKVKPHVHTEEKKCCNSVKKDNTRVRGEEKNCCDSLKKANPHVHAEEKKCCEEEKEHIHAYRGENHTKKIKLLKAFNKCTLLKGECNGENSQKFVVDCPQEEDIKFWQDGHYDHLVQDGEDSFVIHHSNGIGSCIVRGLLKRANGQVFAPSDVTKDVLGHLQEASKNLQVKSKLFVNGICCASEVPLLKQILADLPGLEEEDVTINVVKKEVSIRHSHTEVNINQIMDHLQENEFESKILFDGEAKKKNILAVNNKTHEPNKAVLTITNGLNDLIDSLDSVKLILLNIKGVESCEIAVHSKDACISYIPFIVTVSSMLRTLENNGYQATIKYDEMAENIANNLNQMLPNSKKNNTQVKVPWNVLLGLVLWLISWLSYIEEPPGFEYVKYLSVVAVALCLPSIALKAFASLKHRVLDINCLLVVAVIGAIGLQDFHEAAAVVVVFSLSHYLENRATSKARSTLEAVIALKPEVAWKLPNQDDTTRQMLSAVEDVEVGDILIVKTGEKVPVDSVVIKGKGTIDESNMTGESRPVKKVMGDTLTAGSVNSGTTFLVVECLAKSEDSAVARLVRLIEEAQTKRTHTEQLVEKIANIYTPIIVFAALLLGTIPWGWGVEVGEQYLRTALTLLVVACPCALVISTPITYVSGIAAASTMGVLVKGGKYLETLAQLSYIAFDKTGTITKGAFKLVDIHLLDNEVVRNKKELLDLVTIVEANSTHPIALAVKSFQETYGYPSDSISEKQQPQGPMFDVEELEIIPGEGIKATMLSKQVVHVGNTRMLNRLVKVLSDNRYDEASLSAKEALMWASGQEKENGSTVCWVLIDYVPVGIFSVYDEIRSEAVHALDGLQKLNVNTVMLTGDNEGSAAKVFDALNSNKPLLNNMYAGLLPDEKVQHVIQLRDAKKVNHRVVAMVGDGVNDAPALAAANLGIAMGASASPVALETADIALMDNDLGKVYEVLKLGRSAKNKIIFNIIVSMVSKTAMIVLAVLGYVTLTAAIFVDIGAMLLVTLNSMELLTRKPAEKVKKRTLSPTEQIPSFSIV